MINFTSNLYKTEWLELVFQNRNKTYGAYELRLHNNQTTVKSLIIASILFTSLIISPMVYDQLFHVDVIADNPIVEDPITVVNLMKADAKVPEVASAPKAPIINHATIANPPLRVVQAERVTIEAPTQVELSQAEISSMTSAGEQGSGLNQVDVPAGNGGTGIAETPPVDNTVHALSTIEAYPEFPGGQAAFAKFMSRNLRFPNMAIEAGIFGKVFVSFIIEKNGELSNIKIMKGIGAGCDEEAIRVLSKSPKWKAGVQNDQNVRVMYTIPINFQLPE